MLSLSLAAAVVVVPGFVGAVAPPFGPAAGVPAGTSLVSVSRQGVPGNHNSDGAQISADGRYVAFSSIASDLVPGDTNGFVDVFVRDLRQGITMRVSLTGAGGQANGPSYRAAISPDGRYVAFGSSATNLVYGDTNNTNDVFVRDRQTGATSRVSLNSFQEQGNGYSSVEGISADGRYVMFGSNATNLVRGVDANGGNPDVYLRDRQTARTTRVNVSTAGVQSETYSSGVAISADGRYALFTSQASNLVPDDTNGWFDAFVRDRVAGTTIRVSLPTGAGPGIEGNGESFARAMSPDGRYVVFDSYASNLVPGDTNGAGDVFLRDLRTGSTSRVNLSSTGAADDWSGSGAAVSATGRYVAFSSRSPNLVPGDTNSRSDVFVRDRRAGTTIRVSVSNSGAQGDGESYATGISANGRRVVFISEATTFAPGDTNGRFDVFLWRS